MKILLVNDYGTMAGGAEIQMVLLRDELRKRGYDARLFTSSARPSVGESYADYECFGSTSRFRTLLQTANPWAYWRLRQVLAEFKPDIVHVKMFLTQLSPLILPLLRNVPSLYHVVWYRPVCPLGTKMLPDRTICQTPAGVVCYQNRCLPLRDWLPLMLQMRLLKRWRNVFNIVIALSKAVKSQLVSEGIDQVEVVSNGVRIRPLRPSLSAPPTVVFAGRLVVEKGADVLLKAFAEVVKEIPLARLLIAGDGPERDNLNALSKSLGISSHVIMLGHIPRTEIERLFDVAWVQAVPSRWAEPFGIVATEAMMRGTAVVASSSGGLSEIVQDGKTGFLVPSGSVSALSNALIRILNNCELAEQMGRVGREVALSHFNEKTFVESFIQLYKSICSKHKENRNGDL